LLRLAKFRRFGVEPTEAGFSVADDSRQRLVHFMRDGRRQLTHSQRPSDANQFCFRIA